jgi:hypothetical protein
MRIISCASYYGTGSSAITDYLSEYENCYSLTNYEFRFVQDPDGISDLEYNLVENHNRHNSGHALKRYMRLVDFYSGNMFIKKYEPFFDNKWREISYQYVNSLIDFSFKGWWQYDLLDKGLFFYYRKLLPNKILHLTIWRNTPDKQLNVLPREVTYCSRPSEKKFLECTRQYLENLFTVANKTNKQNIIVDQIVPPSNLKRFIRYFKDIKVFVVDRDPRDLYLLEKCVWHGGIIPTENVELFCKWYQYTRIHRDEEEFDEERVMIIQFEDLIYKYYETTRKIDSWLGLTERLHILPKKYFDPNISIKNTKLWEKYPELAMDIAYIEKKLSKYLYCASN